MNEFSFIEYLRKRASNIGRVPLGIGDDAAVLDVAKDKQLVVATDVIVESVDFKISELSPEKIGRKALAVNLSDIAAMGATPKAFVISVGKPPHVSVAWLKRFYNGLFSLSKQFDVSCVGGDFSSSKEFFASVTIFGEARPFQIVKRSGAKKGDWIAVTGALGGSILRRHCDFIPRVMEGLFLSEHFTPTAMIDISDGLVQDLTHVLRSSKAGVVLDLDRIPVSLDSIKLNAGNKTKALISALSDGEDFELLFTVPAWQKANLTREWKKKFPKVQLSWIGTIIGASRKISWRRNGKPISSPKLPRQGFSHF